MPLASPGRAGRVARDAGPAAGGWEAFRMRLTERLTARHGALLVVDMQERLLEAMGDREAVVAGAVRLVRGASVLKIPTWATEQYPRGLGGTVPALAELVPDRPAKLAFRCSAEPQLLEQLYGRLIRHVTVA